MDAVQKNMRHMESMIRRLVESGSSTQSSEGGAIHAPRTLDEWVLSAAGSHDGPVQGGVAGGGLPEIVSRQVRIIQSEAHPPQSPGPPVDADEHDQDNDDFLIDAAHGAPMKDILYRDEEERLRQESMLHTQGGSRLSLAGTGRYPQARERDPFRRIGVPIPIQRGDRLRNLSDPIQLGYCICRSHQLIMSGFSKALMRSYRFLTFPGTAGRGR
jgi:hypothetical protein